MAIKLKPLKEQTILITGASSGIGLQTARDAAKRGANVVLVARNEEVLQRVAQEIEAAGGKALAVAADVADRVALENAADAALARFGGIDTWVNNAGLGLFGKLEETDTDDAKRMYDTNFWGVVNGCLIALKILKAKGGALITIGSVESDTTTPLQAMYASSKHAVQGYIDGLRTELAAEGASVSVTLVKPSAINTPFGQHARNYTDRQPQLPPPVYPPEEVAYAILHAAEHPRRDVIVGSGGRMMSGLQFHAPSLMDKINEKVLINIQKRDEPARQPLGTLYHSGSTGEVHGDEPFRKPGPSLYTRISLNPIIAVSTVVAAGLAAAIFVYRDEVGRRLRR